MPRPSRRRRTKTPSLLSHSWYIVVPCRFRQCCVWRSFQQFPPSFWCLVFWCSLFFFSVCLVCVDARLLSSLCPPPPFSHTTSRPTPLSHTPPHHNDTSPPQRGMSMHRIITAHIGRHATCVPLSRHHCRCVGHVLIAGRLIFAALSWCVVCACGRWVSGEGEDLLSAVWGRVSLVWCDGCVVGVWCTCWLRYFCCGFWWCGSSVHGAVRCCAVQFWRKLLVSVCFRRGGRLVGSDVRCRLGSSRVVSSWSSLDLAICSVSRAGPMDGDPSFPEL